MNELINIILVLFLTLFLMSGGLFYIYQKNKISIISLDHISQNLILLFNFIWIASIFNFSKNAFCIFLFIFSSILFTFIIKKKKISLHLDFFSLISIFLILILAVVISNDLFLSHDSRLYWIEKAKIFYNDQFVNDDKTIKNEYPHFGTFLWAFFWKNSFLDYEYVGRIPYLLIYIFSISYLVNVLKVKLSSKLILIFIIILLSFESKNFDGRQDILFFSYNIFISRFLFEIFIEKKEIKKNLILTILTLNLILWTKTDGLLYLLVYGLILLIYLKNKLKFISLASIAFIFMVKLYFYTHWNISLNPSAQMYDSNILQRIIEIDLIYRSYSILYWYIINLIKNPLLLVSITIIGIIFLKNKKILIKFNYIFLFYVFITLGIFASFLPTMYDFPFAMIGSFDRIIMQHSGIFLLPILYFLKKNFK